ncbi:MAG: hypothetical protein V1848_01750 [Candidatus Magasanikbacteria bacterium]
MINKMLPYITTATYTYTAPIEETINKDVLVFDKWLLQYKIPCISFIDNLNELGVIMSEREKVAEFIKNSPEIMSQFQEILDRVSMIFKDDYKLYLDISSIENEEPELFLVIFTHKSSEEAVENLQELDHWFIPSIYKKNSRFNITVDFE